MDTSHLLTNEFETTPPQLTQSTQLLVDSSSITNSESRKLYATTTLTPNLNSDVKVESMVNGGGDSIRLNEDGSSSIIVLNHNHDNGVGGGGNDNQQQQHHHHRNVDSDSLDSIPDEILGALLTGTRAMADESPPPSNAAGRTTHINNDKNDDDHHHNAAQTDDEAKQRLTNGVNALMEIVTKKQLKNPLHQRVMEAALSTSSSSSLDDVDVGAFFREFQRVDDDHNEDATPITDIQVYMKDRGEKVPDGYEILKKSVAGRDADVNKGSGGGRHIYLCYEKSSKTNHETSPITDLAIIHEDMFEEAPIGFEQVKYSTGGNIADLNAGSGGRRIFLCTRRGSGAPLTSIGIIYPNKREGLPMGYELVSRTPTGGPADLNSGTDASQLYVCYRRDLHALFKPFTEALKNIDRRRSVLEIIALLMCLHDSNEELVIQSLTHIIRICDVHGCFHMFLGRKLFNYMVYVIADAQYSALSRYPSNVQSHFMKALVHIFKTQFNWLEIETCIRIYECIFFARHEDRKLHYLKSLIHFMFDSQLKQQSQIGTPTIQSATESISNVHLSNTSGIGGWIQHNLIPSLVENIALARSSDLDINRFQRYDALGMNFEIEMSRFLRYLFQTHFEQIAGALLLVLCKLSGQEANAKHSGKSELVKRKLHAIKHLKLFLELSSSFFCETPKRILLLRRILCTSLLQSSLTIVPSMFQSVLDVFQYLWRNCMKCLKVELGVILDTVLMGMMDSINCSPEQKIDLLTSLALNFNTPISLVELYYNYDNDLTRRYIFERLIHALCNQFRQQLPSNTLAEGAAESIMTLQLSSLATLVTFLQQLCEFVAEGSQRSLFAEFVAESQQQLQQSRIGVNVAISPFTSNNALAQTLLTLSPSQNAVSFFSPPTSPSGTLNSPIKGSGGGGGGSQVHHDQNRHKRSQSCSIILPLENNSTSSNFEMMKLDPATTGNVFQRESIRRKQPKRHRSNTWIARQKFQKEAQATTREALNIAETDSVKAAVRFLIRTRGVFVPEEIASFLYGEASLNKAEVGDFLACEYDHSMSADDFRLLRDVYVSQLDFTNTTLAQALRQYLCHSGFRLPGEAQKVDRLIQAFADAYARDNPGIFDNTEAAYLLSFALIMLNTDMHDPRLRSAKNARPPMTKVQFIKNINSAECGKTLKPAVLSEMFDGIASSPIEWQNDALGDRQNLGINHTNGGARAYNAITDPGKSEKAFRIECELLVRQGQAILKTESVYTRKYMTPTNKQIVKGMFEVAYPRIKVLLANHMERVSMYDDDARAACLDGLKYATLVAIAVGMREEMIELAHQIAKITYMEQRWGDESVATLRNGLLADNHLDQAWIKKLKTLDLVENGWSLIVKVADHTKQALLFHREQNVLRMIEADFTEEIHLQDPERIFIRDGHLTKVSSAGKFQLYRFFLFNDLLLYARDSFQKLKLHKVLHLSFCRLIDVIDKKDRKLEYSNAFRIVSPQKSFLIIAPSHKAKTTWMEDIAKCIRSTRERQRRWVENAVHGLDLHDSQSKGDSSIHNRSLLETMRRSNRQPEAITDVKSLIHNSGSAPTTPISLNLSSSLSPLNTDQSRLLSSFLSRSATSDQLDGVCRMCIREFTILRRKYICPWCAQTVCSPCSSRKIDIPDSDSAKARRVCDACYGLLSGDVAEDNAIVTTEEHT